MKNISTKQIIFIILLYGTAKIIWNMIPVDFLPETFKGIINDFFGPSFIMFTVFWFFTQIFWKIPCLGKITRLFFETKPNLQGTWKGFLKYKWENKELEKTVFLVIKQINGFSVNIWLFTDERTSYSLFADIVSFHNEQKIIYIYRNEESPSNKEKNPSHEGLCQLNIIDSKNCLQGTYYTSRKTFGELILDKRNRKVVMGYRNAQKLFGVQN